MRLRSRWLKIAAVAVVLVGGLWWLTRPKLDPRFVGTWRSFPGTYVFYGDGSAVFRHRFSETPQEKALLWRIDSQGHLVLADRMTPIETFTSLFERPRGNANTARVWRIRDAASNQIMLENVEEPSLLMGLKRVSSADSVR
jgi:hypothetical protein